MSPAYIADKSALVHLSKPIVADRLAPLIGAGEVATCGIIELEILFSARNETDLVSTRKRRQRAYPRVALAEADFVRAEDVMELLARTGHHRAVSLPDLLVAAVAERSSLIVLHYDGDFELIAGVTGQPMEWVAPRGSL